MIEKVCPNKTFFKIIFEDSESRKIKEIHYIGANENGELYLEKHLKDGEVLTYPLLVQGE